MGAVALLCTWGCSEVVYDDLTKNCQDDRCGIPTEGEGSYTEGRDQALDAARIVADREEHGAFESLEDLDRVPRIGPRTLRGIEADVAFGPGSPKITP